MKQKHPVSLLKEWFAYDADRGIIIRRKKENTLAHTEISYRSAVYFKGHHYPYGVLCWILYYGRYPKHWIDHKDRVKAHNWITNLREATPTQNQQNKAGSGIYPKGVTWRDRKANPFQAKIRVDGKRIHLGSFATENEAAEAYREACLKYHGEFTCTE